jgi:hypothetical protein
VSSLLKSSAVILGLFGVFGLMPSSGYALDLDWSGQFRSSVDWVRNYSLGNTDTATAAGSYTIPSGGQKDANFETLFMRLTPRVIVNDNVYLKSEWWLGDPIFGFFGNANPYSIDQRNWFSTQSRGSVISAQRFWAEFMSDVGTVQVGRVPLNWGLGVVWNSGDGLWDRYQSTGDAIRLISKFGSFSFVPSIIKYSMGNALGGACDFSGGACAVKPGSAGVSDYSLAFKFENPDDDFEGGVNFIRRIAGAAQDADAGYLGFDTAAAGFTYNTWDIYLHKGIGKFTFAGELPVVNGDLGGAKYKTYAVALEGKWKPNDTWDASVKAGRAPGQDNIQGASPDKFRAFYSHPGYKLGLIMFNYQLAGFAGLNSLNDPTASAANLSSPYFNPIVNANYLSATGAFHTQKWTFHTTWTFAHANKVAQTGFRFFNTRDRSFHDNNGGDQANSLGWEMDYGTRFTWDENFQFGLDFGWWFPGDFFKFSNSAASASTQTVFASAISAGVTF